MNQFQQFLTKYQIALWALLAYLLSWWSVPLAEGRLIPHGPALAAMILLAVTAGRLGLGNLWRRVTHWRVAWYWYLIGPGIIAAYLGGAYALNLLLGATVMHAPGLPSLGTILMLLLVGGQWEEPGWTGYALPTLQVRFANRANGALLAALVVGVFRAIWHLPLFLYGHIPWFDVAVSEIATQLIIAWLFNRSGGSVLIVMVFHFASNIFNAFINSSVFTGNDWTNYYALFVALQSLIALGILWKSGLRLGQKDVQQPFTVADQKAARTSQPLPSK